MKKDYMKNYAIPYLIGKGLDLGLYEGKIIPSVKSVRKDRTLKPDIVSDLIKLKKVEDLSQDYIFASNILQIYHDTFNVINSWKRVLKENGRIILTTPHGEDLDLGSLGNTEEKVKQLFTEKTLWLYLTSCGLKVISKRVEIHEGKRYMFFVCEK
jgi:ubiquinone/menaquinone biosynthesis C-methylase UbiE